MEQNISFPKSIIRFFSKHQVGATIFLITLVGVMNFALLLNKLGFYREDWYIIWAGVKNGSRSLIPMFAGERPAIGYLYAILYPILGNHPLPWHIYALVIRLLGVVSFYWLVSLLWPRQKLATSMAALLFLCYPGLLQQAQANTFQFILTSFGMGIFSIALTIYSIKTTGRVKQIIATILSILTGVTYPILVEYFIGLEGIRILLVWFVLRKQQTQKYLEVFRKAAWRLVPIYLGLAIFLYWRLFIFESTRHTTDITQLAASYQTNVFFMIARLMIELFRDTLESVILAWFVPLERFIYWGGYPEFLFSVLISLLTMTLVFLFIRFIKNDRDQDTIINTEKADSKSFLLIGIVCILVSLLPALFANRDARFDFISRLDRYTLPASIGTAILITSLINRAVKSKFKIALFLLLIGLSTSAHINYTLYMGDFWEAQRQIWWQLSWRAPSIKEETMLLVNYPAGFGITEGYEIWAPANLLYQEQPGNPVIMGEILDETILFQIRKGDEKARSYRGIRLKRNFNNTLVLSMPTTHDCLNVIDGNKYELNQSESGLVREIAPYSKIDQINPALQLNSPSTAIFGKEPEHGWCYYYQKAMLARQLGNWEEIVSLGDEVFTRKLSPYDSTEWMPFLDGYASAGRNKEASQIADLLKTMNPYGRYTICQQLENMAVYQEGYNVVKVNELICKGQTG